MLNRLRVVVRALQYAYAVVDHDRRSIEARRITGLEHHEDFPCRICDYTRAQAEAELRARRQLSDAVRRASR